MLCCFRLNFALLSNILHARTKLDGRALNVFEIVSVQAVVKIGTEISDGGR